MQRYSITLLVVAVVLGYPLAEKAWALAMETKGNSPLAEQNYTDWPGIMPLVNDKSRVYQIWVNGHENFYYNGNIKQLNAALANFAKVKVKHHVVVLKPGPAVVKAFDKTEYVHHWQLRVLGGISKAFAKDDPEDLVWQKDPVLTIYLGGGIELNKLEFPKELTLRTTTAKGPEALQNAALQKEIADFVERKKKDPSK
jgi:hypothetical protein